MHDGRMPTASVPQGSSGSQARIFPPIRFLSRERGMRGRAACREILRTSEPPDYALSFTSVSGRSLPGAVSVCHLPFSSSYSITSV